MKNNLRIVFGTIITLLFLYNLSAQSLSQQKGISISEKQTLSDSLTTNKTNVNILPISLIIDIYSTSKKNMILESPIIVYNIYKYFYRNDSTYKYTPCYKYTPPCQNFDTVKKEFFGEDDNLEW